MNIEDIKRVEESAAAALKQLKTIYTAINEMECDVKSLLSMLKVRVYAFPGQKMFRLRDQRLRDGGFIRNDDDLNKTLEELIEEITVEKVGFEENRFNDKKETEFHPTYATGGYYAHNNNYRNDDFDMVIWTSRQALIDALKDKFETAKVEYIKAKEVARLREAEKLKSRLQELEGKFNA